MTTSHQGPIKKQTKSTKTLITNGKETGTIAFLNKPVVIYILFIVRILPLFGTFSTGAMWQPELAIPHGDTQKENTRLSSG